MAGNATRVLKLKRKPCGFRGCDQPGKYQPQLIIPYLKGTSGKPLTIELEVEVCDRHRLQPKRAFISDEGYRIVLKMIKQAGYDFRPPIADVEIQFVTDGGLVMPWIKEQVII